MESEDLSRRVFLGSVAAAAGAALSCRYLPARRGAKAGEGGRTPNVIYILADDLGYGDIEPYGQEKINTPSLRRMAREGMKLTDHYCGTSVCAPSRCSLLTGKHMGHAEITGNGQGPLSAGEVTIAEVMKQAGYATGCAGKWGLGGPGSSGHPNEQGFDHFFGFLNQTRAHRYYPEFVWRNDQKVELEGNHGKTGEQYVHDLFTEESLNFIRAHAGGPFFWYLPYTIPHADVIVPEDSMAPYRGRFPEEPQEDGYYVGQPTPNAARAGMISRMDRDVGRILDLLVELGIEKDTLVIFSSDNGPCPAGGQDFRFFDSTGPLSGAKRQLKEGGIRVPTIAWWPGTIPAGSVSGHVSAFWDVLPTCAELAGVTPPPNDGISMLPPLSGNPARQPEHEYLYWTFRNKAAVRFGNWKYIQVDGRPELYNLAEDLAEQNNLADARPDVVRRAKRYMGAAAQPLT